MPGSNNSFRDTLAKPVIKAVAGEMMKTNAAHILPHYNKSYSKAIDDGLAKKEGNVLKIPLKSTGGQAGRGYNLKINPITGNQHVEVTIEGHMNYGVQYSPREATYETQAREIKNQAGMDASEAFGRLAVDNYLNELTRGINYIPFNPGNVGTSFTSLIGKMRRMGAKGKPNIITSTNMWEHIHNQKHTNSANQLMQVNGNMFNFLEDINAIPTYKTGDRAGACLKVKGSCQSGCKIYISAGTAFAGKRIIRRGEVLEIQGVKAIDMMSHLSQGFLRQFVAQCDVWTDSKGIAAVSIEPELLPLKQDYEVFNSLGQVAKNGGRKNVDKYAMDGASIVVSRGLSPNSEYEQSIVWYDEAMIKSTVDLDIGAPKAQMASVPIKSKTAGNLGKMYFSMDTEIQDLGTTLRWDFPLDYINLFPEYVTRLVGVKV